MTISDGSGDAGADPVRGAGSILAAALLSVPVGAIAWFELLYLAFGLTGRDPAFATEVATFIPCFAIAFAWPLLRADRPATVVRQGCRLGVIVSLMLPVVAFAVLFIWENAEGRPDLGMGGMMLYALPYVSLGAAAVLAILFAIGEKVANKRMRQ